MVYFCCTIPTLVLIFKPCQQITQLNRFTVGQCIFDTMSKVCIFLFQAKQKNRLTIKRCYVTDQHNHLTIKNCHVISQGINFKILCQLKQPHFCQYGLFINNFVWYSPLVQRIMMMTSQFYFLSNSWHGLLLQMGHKMMTSKWHSSLNWYCCITEFGPQAWNYFWLWLQSNAASSIWSLFKVSMKQNFGCCFIVLHERPFNTKNNAILTASQYLFSFQSYKGLKTAKWA